MWTTAAFLAFLSLAPAQNEQLRLTNDRTTYGFLGAARTDNKILPGDIYFVTFDIENLKVDNTGKVLYSMGMELLNPQGKKQYSKDPQDLEAFNALGTSRLPGFAHVEIGTDTLPGEYTLKVTVTDRAAKKTEVLSRKFEVLPREFGLVRLFNSYDPSGQLPAPNVGVAGQSFWINFYTVGFQRDRATKQPNISLEMRIFDDTDKATLAKPFVGEANKDVPQDWQMVPMQFVLPLNRSGKFTVKLKATDLINKKTSDLSFPVLVQDSK